MPVIWIAIIALFVAGYFAACSTALKSYSRKRLADMLDERGKLDRLEPLVARTSQLILLTGALRTGANLVALLATFYVVERYFRDQPPVLHYTLAFLIAGVLVSVFAVAIPFSWSRYRREEIVVGSIPLLNVLLTVFKPLTVALHVVDPIVRRISGASEQPDEENAISDQVLSVVEEHESASGEVDEAQKEMLEAVFELPTTTAGEIMTPRTDVCGVSVTSTLTEVKQAIIEVGHSRIPVYEENLDNIVGILYAKDLIRFVENGDEIFDLRACLRDAFLVPESKSVRELLGEFKQRKVHMAIVLDEYGGTAGLVTIEDILEEIVGEIQDEYEPLEPASPIEQVDEHTSDVDARIRIGDLNDALDVELPEDEDYDTLGGFVFSTLGHIPEQGESFEFENMRFIVTDVERTKVRRVRIERAEVDSRAGDS
ncbi:hemolysin family protein [Phycisphaerales bacterium AB-hyl4]|uniref:Hemolysin family protein n=1 Tax=Natronomicrosphaera hydrolytica TaxID=3242702 RepID=A0ABV4U639_9BACT